MTTTFKIGQRVKKTMGCPQEGTVVPRFFGPFTDGQYRQPEGGEEPVYVQWDDGTRGWIHASFLAEV